ncbi:hypothetical protein [Geodermatophilus maliterrae]|uniref:Uncharacterized protein n=1 Tax=Geodermatophilus maliterrae TaxID=3162531 RepID=A0ABV3XA41_9ACTN
MSVEANELSITDVPASCQRSRTSTVERVRPDAREGSRPEDEDICTGRDTTDAALLNGTAEVSAEEGATAPAVRRELAREVSAFVDFDAPVEGVHVRDTCTGVPEEGLHARQT